MSHRSKIVLTRPEQRQGNQKESQGREGGGGRKAWIGRWGGVGLGRGGGGILPDAAGAAAGQCPRGIEGEGVGGWVGG